MRPVYEVSLEIGDTLDMVTVQAPDARTAIRRVIAEGGDHWTVFKCEDEANGDLRCALRRSNGQGMRPGDPHTGSVHVALVDDEEADLDSRDGVLPAARRPLAGQGVRG